MDRAVKTLSVLDPTSPPRPHLDHGPGAREAPHQPTASTGMKPPFRLTAALARSAAAASRLLGRGSGTVIGGMVLLRLRPDAVRRLSKGRTCALVSGSNGKTTTTRFLADAVRSLGPVASNSTGSNMTTGIATALLDDASPSAVLEVDEYYLPENLAATGARVIVLTNVSRDQLDRSGGVADLVQTWRRALAQAPADTVVITTCDDPLTTWVASAAPRAVWVATPSGWTSDSALCPSCGGLLARETVHWWCGSCGFARPEPHWRVDGHQLVGPDGVHRRIELALPGRANRGNASLAVAAAAELGVPPATALAAAEKVTEIEGRFSRMRRGGHEVRVLLAKNPASWSEVLDLVREESRPLVFASNGRAADGRDMSWLYDVPFETLAGRTVAIFGERSLDMAIRLETAGALPVLASDLDGALAELPDGPVDLVASYTVLQDLLARQVGGRREHP
jgi:UDP-N-acetylmuramyl tripeptide synthase